VSIGKMDWKTPIGETHVIQKEKHPNWYPPEGVRKEHLANGDPLPAVVKAGPDNPLGDYAMRLAAGGGTYLIHGTNNPMAVGMAITHGCVRMYPEDVAALFPLIPVGTKVWLINEPVKVAFVDGELLMEAHPPVDEEGQNTSETNLDLLSQKLDQALGSTTAAIHWDFAKEALQAANGIPTVVGLQADLDTAPSADPAASPTPPAPTPAAAAPPAASTTSPAATSSNAATDSTAATLDATPAAPPPVTVTLGTPKAVTTDSATATSSESPASGNAKAPTVTWPEAAAAPTGTAPDAQPALAPLTRDADASGPPRPSSSPQQP